jgi:hypothetical protein
MERMNIIEKYIATYSPDNEERRNDPLTVSILVEEDYPYEYACVYFPNESEWKRMEEEALARIHFTINDIPNYPEPDMFYLVERQYDYGKYTDYILYWEQSDEYTGWRRFLAVYYKESPLPYDIYLLETPPPLPSL